MIPKIYFHPARRSRCGFTLIELLVVIAIIAVLAGLALPVISNMRENGNSAQCISNLKQIGVAIDLYANDNNNDLPPLQSADGKDWDQGIITTYLPGRTRAGSAIQVQNKVFNCPSAKYTGTTSDNITRTYSSAECRVAYPTYDAVGSGSPLSYDLTRKRTNLESTANSLLMFDGVQDGTNASSRLEVLWANLSGTQDLTATARTSTYIDYRHSKAFHALFADDHVDTISRARASTVVTKTVWTGMAQ